MANPQDMPSSFLGIAGDSSELQEILTRGKIIPHLEKWLTCAKRRWPLWNMYIIISRWIFHGKPVVLFSRCFIPSFCSKTIRSDIYNEAGHEGLRMTRMFIQQGNSERLTKLYTMHPQKQWMVKYILGALSMNKQNLKKANEEGNWLSIKCIQDWCIS